MCLKNMPAVLVENINTGEIIMDRRCEWHGRFRVPVWRGRIDFDKWTYSAEKIGKDKGIRCPAGCGLCEEHRRDTCCVLLEVTERCNLHCRFCFADAGKELEDPYTEKVKGWIRDLSVKCRGPLLQFSGGEPTLRDDLPALASYAKEAGCEYVQINTNGIRLAEDEAYVKALAESGVDFVFLQFDGTEDSIYRQLRGKDLFDIKQRAIENCGKCGLGVTLVPTIVRGVNEKNIGDMIRFAVSCSPVVRGVHFQPVSWMGRIPRKPENIDHFTLDELLKEVCQQTGIPEDSFIPSRCDHPLCGFHGSFLFKEEGSLLPLAPFQDNKNGWTNAVQNRRYVGCHWKASGEKGGRDGGELDFSAKPDMQEEERVPGKKGKKKYVPLKIEHRMDEMDFGTFLKRMKEDSFTLTSMVFQDASNLNVERLMRCSLHVYDNETGKIIPFCAKYLTTESLGE